MPPMLLARDSTFDFSSPSGRTAASTKSGDPGGAREAGPEPEPEPQPQPATARTAIAAAMRAAVAAAAGGARRAFMRTRILTPAPHSTVTVFARLRGWSTLRPRARAMS